MSDLKALNFEKKFIAFFAISSLLIVLFSGIFSGIDFSTIIFRAIMAVVIFSGLAYAIIFVLKSFLPEVYIVLNKTSSVQDGDESFDLGEKDEESGADADVRGDALAESAESAMDSREESSEEVPSVDGKERTDLPGIDKKEPKLGKHLMKFQGIENYEPKIMAEAVRTMMSKDEE